jgi:hypothetical protein
VYANPFFSDNFFMKAKDKKMMYWMNLILLSVPYSLPSILGPSVNIQFSLA